MALLKPFTRAQVQDRGGEKHKRCDSKNGVVHEIENRVCVLRKWSRVDKDFVSAEEGEVVKQRGNEVTIEPKSKAVPDWGRGAV
jgi:hypothetical protein